MATTSATRGPRAKVSVWLDMEVAARLDSLAEREVLTRSELLRRLIAWALEERNLGDALLAAEADEAACDPDNQGRIPWEQVKAASRALAAEDQADAEEIGRVLADPNEEWTPLEDVLAEAGRLP